MTKEQAKADSDFQAQLRETINPHWREHWQRHLESLKWAKGRTAMSLKARHRHRKA